MLTDTKLKLLKPKKKLYKVADRDGLYVAVLKLSAISFRYDYRINDRRQTIAIGLNGQFTLSEACEKLLEAKKLVAKRVSFASQKQKIKD